MQVTVTCEVTVTLRRRSGLKPLLTCACARCRQDVEALRAGTVRLCGLACAETELRTSFDLDSTFALTYLWLGQTLDAMGKLDESVQVLRRGVELVPLEPGYKAALARSLARRGDRAEAQ